jgi:hypothetical protein
MRGGGPWKAWVGIVGFKSHSIGVLLLVLCLCVYPAPDMAPRATNYTHMWIFKSYLYIRRVAHHAVADCAATGHRAIHISR